MPDELSLFDLGDPPAASSTLPLMISSEQRSTIRKAFQRLGVLDAPAQFEVVFQLTGQRVRSPGELQASHAHQLILGLSERTRTLGTERTGNAWTDREEDTWIDRL